MIDLPSLTEFHGNEDNFENIGKVIIESRMSVILTSLDTIVSPFSGI